MTDETLTSRVRNMKHPSLTAGISVIDSLFKRACAIAWAALLVAAPVLAQQVPVRDLPKPVRELEDPLSFVAGGMELRPGQLLVIDGVEMQLALADFAKGTQTAVGRQGSGPGEYRAPGGLIRMPGDTIWVVDAAQQRLVAFTADLKPGPTIPLQVLDQQTMSTITAPFLGDRSGRLYASAMSLQMGRSGAAGVQMRLPDSVSVVRLDLRDQKTKTELAKVRFPTSGQPEMKQLSQTQIKMSLQYPGLVASDPWTVFPDGRLAIVRGNAYTVEFIAADGKRSAPVRVAYDAIPVTDADKKAEMDEAQRLMKEQMKAAQKMMPPNVQFEFELLPPATWPSHYPPVAALGLLTAPDGRLWVKRATPFRAGREQWDVLDQAGKLVARWRLPAKTTLIAVGQGAVYTVRTDEDDLRYVQRVEVPS